VLAPGVTSSLIAVAESSVKVDACTQTSGGNFTLNVTVADGLNATSVEVIGGQWEATLACEVVDLSPDALTAQLRCLVPGDTLFDNVIVGIYHEGERVEWCGRVLSL